MARKTLNAKNLQSLGAERLAELLLEISAGNASAKQRLRLELAGAQGAGEVSKEVRKRLTAIARSHSFIDWRKRKALVNDLETQLDAIVAKIAKSDPTEALDLLWRFLNLANSVFARCDDSSGTVIGVFHAACNDLGEIAEAAKADPKSLAEQASRALRENDYGQYDALVENLSPALGQVGLEHLKQLVIQYSREGVPAPRSEDRQIVDWGPDGPIHADDHAEQWRDITAKLALQAIADAQGDVDGFIAQQSEKARTVPRVAAEIAQRLLSAGRAEEAWDAVNAIDEDRSGWIPLEWENARLDVMEALGRREEAQAFRLACFERSLRESHLRAYLKRLPDFDDVEAEERALSFALAYPNVHQALAFLIAWPNLERAAALVLERTTEIDGDHYEILTPAAYALAAKHPLAASLLFRAMIDFSLAAGRSTRYRHAARNLAECASLAAAIGDFGAFEAHEVYVTRLREEHGRKSSFWNLVD